MNIMDGMDAARFTSGNPAAPERKAAKPASRSANEQRADDDANDAGTPMPQVLRNLNNR
ncbi:hypothetical protein [Paenibacillus sp.]|uniref:hypothetical protein n=1 Tax=Paenibacillus sp. TaxID=58172 RepID=UPI002D272373|nr:hypothetical protein [Paenibacillus sp.]HZG57910.1 hypothetical protein [Paenibacillus sp.]